MAVRAVVDSASLPDASTAKWTAPGGVCAGSRHVCMNARRVLPCQLHCLQNLLQWYKAAYHLEVLPGKGPGCGRCVALGSASWSAGHVSVCSCVKAAVCVTDQLKSNHQLQRWVCVVSARTCVWPIACGQAIWHTCKASEATHMRRARHHQVLHFCGPANKIPVRQESMNRCAGAPTSTNCANQGGVRGVPLPCALCCVLYAPCSVLCALWVTRRPGSVGRLSA